ncbi:MAG: ATP-dependent RecD-like DNA helicase [Lachnospiraceae bacterium]
MVITMEAVTGYVEHIVYQNPDNGYSVFHIVSEGDEIVCVGLAKGLTVGETIEANGTWVSHMEYGEQFKISTLKVIPPQDKESILRYLSSGAIKGIGQALAKRIVKRFGADTIRIMEEEPEKLIEIKGISERIAREIAGQMEDKRELRSAMIFLQQYGINQTLAVKIYEKYRDKIYTVIHENPYVLAEDISGIGFKIADEIASKVGITTDSDYRIASGILYVLLQAIQDGHTYLPLPVLQERCVTLLEVSDASIGPIMSNMMMDKKIIIKTQDDKKFVYASRYYYMELKCAKLLQELSVQVGDNCSIQSEDTIKKEIKALAFHFKVELDDLQIQAIVESARNGLVILSGGPGTGKTTTINMMIHYFEEQGFDILLAAPTGRAAKRMTEATGCEAKTIHRMLELNGQMQSDTRHMSFERNAENPLEADVIIIDEMSMVDIQLFQALLQAVCPGTRLVLVGDVDQLPSVGPGQVLRDIMKSGRFCTTVLHKIFRQAAQSDIVVNAHKINKGMQITLDNKSMDFFFLERNNPEVIYKHMIELIQNKLPKFVKATSMDIQVLTPMRKGALGVDSLNSILQKYLNAEASDKREKQFGDTLFREGDKVMQTKNNYQLEWEIVSKYNIPIDKGVGVFNGDVGRILEIKEYASEMTVSFDGRIVSYPFSGLDELELAYAITIHKSQGSEYPAVILPLLSGPRVLFNRNLLYTAVTRAKTCVTILGSSEVIRSMIENESQSKRYTSLDLRIEECYMNYHGNGEKGYF